MDFTPRSAVGPFDARLQTAARRLLDAGRISDVRILHNGRVVTGIAGADPMAQGAAAPSSAVQGASGPGSGAPVDGAPYRVYIRYRQGGASTGELCPEGECSCGDPSPCPHVAAVALFAATQGAPAARALAPRGQEAAAAPRSAQQCLSYVLDVIDGGCQASLWVTQSVSGAREIPEGARPFAPRAPAAGDDQPRYVDAHDRAIVDLLPRQAQGPWALRDETGFELLRLMVATGRALWRVPYGRTLRAGPAREIALGWRIAPDGAQRLVCLDAGQPQLIVGVRPAAYLDPSNDECGPVRLPFDPELLRRHWQRAALAPEQVADVVDQLARQPDTERFPRPRALRVQPQRLSTLHGHLTLSRGPRAVLNFVYNGRLIAADALRAEDQTVRHFDGIVHEIGRDRDAERRLRMQLTEVMRDTPASRDAWLGFLATGVPALRDQGWTVGIEDGFPYRLAPVADWYVDLTAAQRADWFDLQLGIVVDGRPVNLLPALIDYLQAVGGSPAAPSLLATDHLFVLLEDGRHLPVPTLRLRRIADTLVELFDRDVLTDRQALSLPHHQAARVALLVGEGATAEAGATQATVLRSADASLLTLIGGIAGFSGIEPLQAPPECRATLRDYQCEGLGWLQFLRRHRLGGILADDMGLGKTLQTLAHLALEKTQGRLRKQVLIVAPVSVIGNWQREARRFTPALTSVILHGAQRKRLYPSLGEFDVIITGYPSLLFDADVLLQREFSFVILDEAQMIKNPHARVSQAARALRAEHRLCLTGTPMENHLGDLWSLCNFVQPGLLGTERAFQRQYRTPIEKGGDTRRAESLRGRIAPFLIRRTKDAVARELPPKTEIVESIVLDEQQRDLYDGIRLSMHRRVRESIEQHGLERSRITLLDALLKLRQVCCDPRLLGAAALTPPVPSAKLDWLATALPELIADGRRILLFSQFTSMLRLIESVVQGLSIPYGLLTGDTQGRPAVIERFQSGQVPLFLVSLKAGGAGLNLTAADTVIHYDPWWNPAVENQATDRAHRIGQARAVFVYKLIAQGTVEEKILQLQADKHALVSRLYAAGNASPSQLSAADLEALLAP